MNRLCIFVSLSTPNTINMATQNQTQTWGQLLDLLTSIDDQGLAQERTIEINAQQLFSKAEIEPGGAALADVAYPDNTQPQAWQQLKDLLVTMPPDFMDQTRTIHFEGQHYDAVAEKKEDKVVDTAQLPT